jgi:hypothetical protein
MPTPLEFRSMPALLWSPVAVEPIERCSAPVEPQPPLLFSTNIGNGATVFIVPVVGQSAKKM